MYYGGNDLQDLNVELKKMYLKQKRTSYIKKKRRVNV